MLQPWLEDWLAWLATQHRKPLTLASYRSDVLGLDAFLARFEIQEVGEITPPMLRRYLVYLAHERGLAPNSVCRAYHAITSFFRYLVDEEILAKNPMERVQRPKRPHRNPPTVFTPDEVRRMVLTASRRPDLGKRDVVGILLLAHAGLRRGEVLGLQWSDLDFSQRTMRIHGKGDRQRIVPMSADLENALWEYLQTRLPLKDPYVWIPDTGPRAPGQRRGESGKHALYRAVRLAAQHAGIDRPFTLHTFRHTFASWLVAEADLRTIQELLGHRDVSTTQIYTQVDARSKAIAVKRLPTLLCNPNIHGGKDFDLHSRCGKLASDI